MSHALLNVAKQHNERVTNPVSVQICTLNEATRIRPCLDAVWVNNPEEVLVIDGGSSDETVAIAEAAGARVLTPGHLGLGPSRQLGYMSTTCRYSAFVDADDLISPTWIATMVRDMEAGGFAALQSSLRAVRTGSWWARGWDQYFKESVRSTADTNMVGRPAMYVTSVLQSIQEPLPSLDEDTHLSRQLELQGLRMGVGTALAYRYVEESWLENKKKWESYGRGYRNFVDAHPERRRALLRHIAFTIPIARSARPVLRGHLDQPLFGLLMATSIARGWRDRSGGHETPKGS